MESPKKVRKPLTPAQKAANKKCFASRMKDRKVKMTPNKKASECQGLRRLGQGEDKAGNRHYYISEKKMSKADPETGRRTQMKTKAGEPMWYWKKIMPKGSYKKKTAKKDC